MNGIPALISFQCICQWHVGKPLSPVLILFLPLCWKCLSAGRVSRSLWGHLWTELHSLQKGHTVAFPLIYIPFSCCSRFIAQVKTWVEVERVDTLLPCDTDHRFVIHSFHYVETFSLHPQPLYDFDYEGMLHFVKGCFCSCWDDHVASGFESIYVMNYIYWFMYVESSFYHWNEAKLNMINEIFNMILNLICEYWEFIIREACLEFSFLCVSWLDFGDRAMLAL